MVVVAVAFVIGGVLGAVLTAALIARGQRALELTPSDFELPIRPPERWRAEPARDDRGDAGRDMDRETGNGGGSEPSHSSSERIERFEQELARRLGREAAATARERYVAANHALRPGFGVMIRMKS
jgi:hypothetical protein